MVVDMNILKNRTLGKIVSLGLIAGFIFSNTALAASAELNRARSLNNSKDYKQASTLLYSLSKNSRYRREQAAIAYEFAESLEGMGLTQSAVFQLIKAVRYGKGNVLSSSLEKLTKLAFQVNDDVGLNFALSKINIRKFPADQKPVLYFRFGEAYLSVNRFKQAYKAFSKVPKSHYLYSKARYMMGLGYSESGKLKSSYRAFTQSSNARADQGVVDNERVAALMGRARVLYHMKRWDNSLEAYRLIPRDSKYYHDMLFESAWAMLRSGKFRSALSNFHSLHSEYYQDYFYPEAALLRAIVYLYICKVDEVGKVLNYYENTYGKVARKLKSYLRANPTPRTDILEYMRLVEELAYKDAPQKDSYEIPYIILRHLHRSSRVRSRGESVLNVEKEIAKIDSMGDWANAEVGAVTKNSLMTRQKASLKRLGKALRAEMVKYNRELTDFGDQKELIKFELISSEKEQARKTLEGRDDFNDGSSKKKASRFSFTKNGYEYWPFQGEYWLDEIGNYHYLGASRCE